MSKFVLLGDLHWGVRGNANFFQENFKRFFTDTLFPYLKKHKIDTVIQLGDTVDTRKFINIITLSYINEYFQMFEDNNITMYTLLGNHDITHSNTTKINSLNEIVKNRYPRTKLIDKPTTVFLDDLAIDLVPWINRENKTSTLKFIDGSASSIIMGHFEITGFDMIDNVMCHDGLKQALFSKFDNVYSGHFHKRSVVGNIEYVGTPYQMDWNDYGQDKGFVVFDSETRTSEFISSNVNIFQKIIYDDTTENYDDLDIAHLKNCMVKLIVTRAENSMMLDRFIFKLQEVGIYDLVVLDQEDFNLDGEDITDLQIEDPFTILLRSIDGIETNLDKNLLKRRLGDIYNEAIEVMNTE